MSNQDCQPNLSPQAIRQTLREKRKGRKLRPCFPCRQRKVKCDDSRPCKKCIERSHEDLCLYEPPRHAETDSKPRPKSNVQSIESEDKHRPSPTLASEGATEDEEARVYLGEQSIPSFVQEQVQDESHAADPRTADLGSDVLPMLGLQASPQELLPDWQSQSGGQPTLGQFDILPGRDEILSIFSDYRHIVYPLYPHLTYIDDFEMQLCSFLQSEPPLATPVSAEPGLVKDLAWRSLLLAILASGTQFSGKPASERRRCCRQYISASLWFLNLTQGFIRPSLQSIQTLIIIVNVLQNELLTEAAWTLLGLLSRQAQALGLHRASDNSSQSGNLQLSKCRLWWTIVWQDSLLSACFDRAPVTAIKSVAPLSILGADNKSFKYEEAMYALGHLLLKLCARNHTIEPQTPTQEGILSDLNEAQHIISNLCENIRVREKCDTLQHLVQHHCFKLHSSFTIGTLLRPSLSPRRWGHLAADQKQVFASQCIESYISSLEAFLDLHAVSIAASRSWAMLHNGLTSALVLAITGQTRRRPSVARLNSRLFETLTRYSAEDEQGGHFWGPHSRAISALKKIDLRRNAETTQEYRPADDISNVVPTSLKSGQHLDLERQETNLPGPMAGSTSGISPQDQGYDNYAFDPEIFNDLSAYLPASEPGNDLVLDDIFDSVLWGDYASL
ncbi:hypothetical protein A1O1_03828 [Capronia coronata CBS 617.96]|uniref:Zn(2)-C6 fungal-type domain-containing protein n=1 Tax=Capronia coronata CBS 617.96 TaxID=1182541 RepID=W9Z872_9EURO|nr:uncharacterized protein A1O1_03828 [Capronia coronata CBS 617.96]EXJ90724.1 hypothetical protein A1O1_03828 [Capronia coronata CBS 617.96]